MTPENQVKEIILLMNPENPGTQTDAVFLVQKYMEKMTGEIAALKKQIALAEARIESEQKLRGDTENAKLEAETRLKKEKEDLLGRHRKPAGSADKPGPGGGRTI